LVIYLRGNQNNIPSPFGGEKNNGADSLGQSADSLSNGSSFIPTNRIITDPRQVLNQTSDEIYTKQLAVIFVERFGSYSNKNNNSHIDNVLALSTDSMVKWLNSQRIDQEIIYEGVTVKVVASSIDTLLKEKALISIGAQETTQNLNSQQSKFRTGIVELTKVGGEWKVNKFYWDE